ncbi:hypothetical protein OAF63_03095 [Saprospiraceae bacterium]|jgi:hypothetical protein|nr:hypothetical protein [Bacteroidota bacterium]MDB4727753.1 hypothetical protein [Saprospiraceae bacterium]MDF1863247.1 hypothetical protein [Saprospiraceae bacterium]
MIYSLRKRHRYTWMILGILLPVFFVAAVMAIPEPAIENEFEVKKPDAFAKLVTTEENEAFLISLRESDNLPGLQVEATAKKPITTSDVTLYFSYTEADNVANAGVIGKITGTGTHRFAIGTITRDIKHFFILFYDANKKEVFDEIKVNL